MTTPPPSDPNPAGPSPHAASAAAEAATAATAAADVAPEDLARADLYAFLAALLARPPGAETLTRAAALQGDTTAIGRGAAALAECAARTTPAAAAREYNALFIGLGRGELAPTASYYLTGFLNDKPLAELRDDLRRLGIARADGVTEPEDSIAMLLEVMAGLIRGSFDAPATLQTQARFFETHLAPWAGHFFADLEAAESAAFYAPVGRIGAAFMAVERDGFRMVDR